MTVFYFKKQMDCVTPQKCFNLFWTSVKALTPSAQLSVNMHITIYHADPYHEIWVTYYDTGHHENFVRHEDFKKGKLCRSFTIEQTPFNEIQKKYKGKLPTKTELEMI